jgi:L-ascorbate metabolism protein UlaG (beta-lactamase superfamily)
LLAATLNRVMCSEAGMRVTHVGTATAILEIDSLRLVTDPALDPPGGHYTFKLGLGSTKQAAPVVPEGKLDAIDAVLLSHDHHADNLDTAGRALLPRAGLVLTTRSGAGRLGGHARGLSVWETHELQGKQGERVRVTALPARHGPPGVGLVDWETIGFLLEWEGQEQGALYISGDTVWFSGIAEIAERFRIGTGILHLGGVRFALTGPIRYTFSGEEAARAAIAMKLATIIPVHYEGWTHFRESRAASEAAFARAGIGDKVRWLVPGRTEEVTV